MSLNKTQKKIALYFTLVSTSLMVAITILTIFLVNFELDKNAKEILETSLDEMINDFQADELENLEISFQTSNRATEEYLETQELPNISQQKAAFEIAQNTDLSRKSESVENSFDMAAEESFEIMAIEEDISEGSSDDLSDESFEMFSTAPTIISAEVEEKQQELLDADIIIEDPEYDPLTQNRQVFSRVVLENGDILFTSDLFDQFFIDPEKLGFQKNIFEEVCIYSYSARIENGTKAGSTVQVGQYCSVTPSEQQRLFLQIILVAILLSISTYFLGIFVSKKLLEPMKKSIDQTRKFVQNCHHELLTPITVALTTIAATKKDQDFKKGIHSIEEDLTHAYEALKLLSAKALYDQAKITFQKIDLKPILKKTLQECQEIHPRKDLTLELEFESGKIDQPAEQTSVKLIFKNLLCNALKYSAENGQIKIKLDSEKLQIENEIENIESLDLKKLFDLHYRGENGNQIEGSGVGLSIVKELCEIHDWKISFHKKNNFLQASIIFLIKFPHQSEIVLT